MFKASYNRAILRLELTTVTPLSIRAGDIGLDPVSTDMVCIRTNHAQRGRTVFIPGSSLRGVIRSTAEAALRGSGLKNAACDPAAHGQSCGRFQPERGELDGSRIHRESCLACRMFGSTALKARCSVRDLFPFSTASGELPQEEKNNLGRANKTEVRPGVFIGRIEGSVKHGPFEQEMVPAGITFWGDIALENYQAWQLGLLISALQELDEGFSQLGSGKSKGLGVVRTKVLSLLHEQKAGYQRPKGVGDLAPKDDSKHYGLEPETEFPTIKGTQHGFMERFLVLSEQLGGWQEAALKSLSGLQGGAR
jgi:CRISPR-associated protein Csm3